jgi:endonuclease G
MMQTSLIEESAKRAKTQDIEKTIEDLSHKENERKATPRQIEQRRTSLLRQVDDPLVVQTRLERILKGNDLTDITYLAQGVLRARAVCRIVIRYNGRLQGYGTGFLIAPGVLMTNHHVLESVDCVRESLAQFSYERDLSGGEMTPTEFALRILPEPILFKDLDLAIVAVEPRSTDGKPLDQYGWLKLNSQPGKAFVGEYLTIIQHPNGERKQICVRENKVLKYSENGPYIWYQTDTDAGASGSPVFNNSWDVVALHHSSVPKTRRIRGQDVWLARNGQPWKAEMGDDQIAWMANEGVRVSRIVEYLRMVLNQHPLVQSVLTTTEPRAAELLVGTGNGVGEIQVRSDSEGNTRILLPIEIGVKIGVHDKAVSAMPQQSPSTASSTALVMRAIEKVVIDQTNYKKRNGYDPKFLGDGLVVPLPKLTTNRFGKALLINGKSEIKYWNYSVVMNLTRRLAYFSAANVDSSKFRGNRDADGDTWFNDTRVEKVNKLAQLGKEFYKKQKEFEADRTLNPFDQGHLTSRQHLQWGDNDEDAKRNGDDSYHYTNCSPQHWKFNQNSKVNGLWFRLEQAAISTLSAGSRLCLINGPVFDAPLSILGPDKRLHLNLKGKRVPDGRFGDVKIPRLFFKVIAYRAGQQLRAKAFVISQEDLVATIDRYFPDESTREVFSDLEIRLYQVKISDLEKLTGLHFGKLSDSDVLSSTEESFARNRGLPIEIEDESQLVF